MPGKTPTVSGSRRHKTIPAPDRLEPQTIKDETAVHLGLVVRKERMCWPPGVQLATFKMLLLFQLAAFELGDPKSLLPLSSFPAAYTVWALGDWPRVELALPWAREPQRYLAFVPRVTHSYKHQTSMCLPLSFFPTEEGEGVREIWQSSREPRPLLTPVDSQLEGMRGRKESSGLEKQAPPSSYLPAASSLLPPQPDDAGGGLLLLPLMSGNCLLSRRGKIR